MIQGDTISMLMDSAGWKPAQSSASGGTNPIQRPQNRTVHGVSLSNSWDMRGSGWYCYDPFFFRSFLYANPWLSTGKTTLFEPRVGHVFFFLSLSLRRPLTTLICVTGSRLPIPDVSSLLFRLLISSRWHMQNVLERSIAFHWLLSNSWLLYINQSV